MKSFHIEYVFLSWKVGHVSVGYIERKIFDIYNDPTFKQNYL